MCSKNIMSTAISQVNNLRHNGAGPSKSYLSIDDVKDLSKICRLCGIVPPEPVIPLFGQECRKKQIPEKINQHLSIQVDEMDPLPKTVCHSCARLIVTWHKFANRSVEIEAKLKQRCNIHGQPMETNEQNATNLNENGNNQAVDTYTCTADSSIGTFVSALFKAQVSGSRTEFDTRTQALADPVAGASQAQSGSPHRRNDTTRNSSFDIYQLGPCTSDGIVPVKIENIKDEYNENEPENMDGSDSQKNFNPLEESDEKTSSYPQVRRFHGARKCRYGDDVYRCSIIYFHRVRNARDESHKDCSTLVCDICDKEIHTWGRFKEYRCRECSGVFLTKESLYLHRASHNGDKNFKCSKCSKSFRWRIHLEKHEKKHIIKTKYVCPTCQRVFSLKCDMLKHRRVHKIKNFKCTKCNLRFSETRYLKLHMTRKHSDDSKKKPAPKIIQASKGKPKMQVQKPKKQSKKISKK